MPTTYAVPNGRTVFDATTYTGAGGTTTFTNNDNGTIGFKPDLVWVKNRNSTGSHVLQDSVRGFGSATKLSSNSTNAENNNSGDATDPQYGYLTAVTSNGFTVYAGTNPAQVNNSGATYVAWQWQAGQGTTSSNTNGSVTSTTSVNSTAGFSIVSFTTQASGTGTIGHGLGVAPSMIILKIRTISTDWQVYHASIGATNCLFLDKTDASTSSTNFNNTAPTSSVFSLGSPFAGSYSTIAYCWAPVAGFSQFGSYTGNGSTDGPFVYTGFKPKFLMYKRTDSTGGWFLVDSSRNPYNTANYWLNAPAYDAEQTDDAIDLNSNGFKIRTTGTGTNANGGSYVYMVWAENPFKFANAR
jgi:hypothetical protein